MKKISFLGLSFLLLYACQSPETDSEMLKRLIDEEWQFRVKESPFLATSLGLEGYGHMLPSVTEADEARRHTFYSDLIIKLEGVNPENLTHQENINLELLKYEVSNNIAEFEYKMYLVPILADAGFHISFARMPQNMSFKTVKDFENYASRLLAYPEYVNQHIELMREGIRQGITMPGVVLQGYEVTISGHIVDSVENSQFFEPYKNLPEVIPPSHRERLVNQGKDAVMRGAVEGYRLFLDFMVNEYIPNARTTLGASELPQGTDYYQQRVQHFTTLQLTVDEVHEKGRQEVARIRAEMMQIIEDLGFDGTFKEFLDFLRTDPRFYAISAEALLKEASHIAKKMDGKLPALFGKLPRLPYGVAPVPDEIAPKYTGGRYVPGARNGTRAGFYWVNTYKLENRPLYVLESLTLHEAVPGHHLQGALAREMEGLPDFRNSLYISAFGEGWGLYSEWLGLEAGFYQDPYSNFGRLTYEMWRACRLVVDTGIHAKGWTRQQVIDYMAENTALSIHEITTETDRYISWPGQALAYKIGELKIKELRAKVSKSLGPKFDLRKFHDKLLDNGAVTLPILERIMDEFIKEELESEHHP